MNTGAVYIYYGKTSSEVFEDQIPQRVSERLLSMELKSQLSAFIIIRFMQMMYQIQFSL